MKNFNFTHFANKKDFVKYLTEVDYDTLSLLDLITYSNEDGTVFVYKSRFGSSNISISYDKYVKILNKINLNIEFGRIYKQFSDISKKSNSIFITATQVKNPHTCNRYHEHYLEFDRPIFIDYCDMLKRN